MIYKQKCCMRGKLELVVHKTAKEKRPRTRPPESNNYSSEKPKRVVLRSFLLYAVFIWSTHTYAQTA